MYYIIRYKKYKGSPRATIISFFCGLLALLAATTIIGLIYMLINYNSKDLQNIIILGVVFIISAALAKFLGNCADKIGQADFERKIKENLKFAIAMAKENPNSKNLYAKLNPQYASYLLSQGEAVLSEDGTITLNSISQTPVTKKPIKLARIIPIILLAAILPTCFIYFLSHNVLKNNSTSAGDESKYATYVKLNNDILWRYDASVTPYVEEFGQDENITFRRGKGNISGITPVLDSFYKDLDNLKEKAQKSPKTDVDESALKLIDETKTMYNTIGEVAAYYNDGGYKADNLARAQEIHTKYMNEIDKWYSDYLEFSYKLNPMAIRVMSKDLDKFKKNGQDYEYYSLKLLVDSEAITQYMHDNSIDDTNVLSMAPKNYEPLLSTLNETYTQYKTYSENKKGSIHLDSLKSDSAEFVDCANRITKIIASKDLNAGIVHKPGVVYANDEPTPINDLDFYLDRMISDYNSSISFDYNK